MKRGGPSVPIRVMASSTGISTPSAQGGKFQTLAEDRSLTGGEIMRQPPTMLIA